jgi:hypothetical protein
LGINKLCYCLVLFRLLFRFILPFLVHEVPRTKNSGFWIPVIQVFASFNLLLSIVVDYRYMIVLFCFVALTMFLTTLSAKSWSNGLFRLWFLPYCWPTVHAGVHRFPKTQEEALVAVLLCLGRFFTSVISYNLLSLLLFCKWLFLRSIDFEYLLVSVWIEGPFGFGLLLSCRITQAFQLYYIFVKFSKVFT